MTQAKEISIEKLHARGMDRRTAALYVGVSPTKFSEMVEAGDMPKARTHGGRKIWDRAELDAAFDALPHVGENAANEWDEDAA